MKMKAGGFKKTLQQHSLLWMYR